MPEITEVRTRGRDILGRFGIAEHVGDRKAIVDDAKRAIIIDGHMREGKNLSRWLEDQDPTQEYSTSDPLSQMDAFERQLYWAGIRTQSDPVKGLFADTVDRFYMSDQPASVVLFPEFINRVLRETLIAPDILGDLIAQVTPVNSSSYRTIYLNDAVGQRRMGRVTQGGEMPRVKLSTSEHAITLQKYGVILEGSYEVYRRMQIDLFARHVARIGMQAMLDKSQDALNVAINGDGNSNPAINYNETALDSGGTAGTLSYKAWLRWGMKSWPYKIDTVVAGEAEMLQLLTLQFPSIDPTMLLALITNIGPASAGDRMRLNPGSTPWANVNLIFFPLAPSNILTGLQRDSALEMVMEVGASITETDKIISQQLNEIAISEVVGFGKMITNA
ncbi:MAG TPA: hypothetical protein VE338_02170, partial [Ktedonobacterales bacterium]|nr:hypothetical protein [Ktedonobacterales bacterium]